MNIFYVDQDPVKAAQMMCDKHIIKMILESAQMLCSVKRRLDGIEYYTTTKTGRKVKRYKLENPNEEAIIYKAGWLHHPSTQWVMKSAYNYIWLYKHMMALNDEYKLRYNKKVDHVSIQKLGELLKQPPKNANVRAIATDATPAMPDECKLPGDVVGSHRKYYVLYKERFAKWSAPRSAPDWVVKGVNEQKEKQTKDI